MTDFSLAAEFPTPDRDEWTAAVEKVLRGSSFEKVLVSQTRDGLDIQPLYTGSDGATTGAAAVVDERRVVEGWDVRQVHHGEDGPACARAVIDELERGVTSVELVAPAMGWSLDSLREATAGVMLDLAPVALAPHASVGDARALADLIIERGDEDTTRCWLGLDPIGESSRGGTTDTATVIERAAAFDATFAHVRTVTVDSSRYADAGATEAQQLGWSIATGIAYLRAFEAVGLAPDAAARTIAFRLSVGADQFMTISVLRAARRLWARVLDASGVEAADPALVQAVTSRAMYSRRDPWVNMLRGTSAALAAGVGGADVLTVLPFDDALGAPDPFARRVARNTQLLLVEESQLARVVDPAAGSWFVESMTDRLANAAWTVLQEVEAAGGIETQLRSGAIGDAIEGAWAARLGELATRRVPVTGVSEFPDLDETPVERADRAQPPGLPIRRMAAPFEDLRDAADRVLAGTGVRPQVHLATLGDLATHTARSSWISNLLAVGGVATVGGDGDGSASPLEAEAKFAASGSPVAVICSSDGVYAERAAATATALKEAGAARVVLAGNPRELRAELEAAGVDEFWHVGVDVLDVLERVHRLLGVDSA